MTEAEWLCCGDPVRMMAALTNGSEPLEHADGRSQYGGKLIGDRKFRRFAIACCRSVWHLLTDERSRKAVEVAERRADGEGSLAEFNAAKEAAYRAVPNGPDFTIEDTVALAMFDDPPQVVEHLFALNAAFLAEHFPLDAQADLIRELVGNPFREMRSPRAFGGLMKVGWLTPNVLHVAEDIYRRGAFDEVGVLADALEEAGCGNADLLGHLRSPVPHTRGCWALDLILGRC